MPDVRKLSDEELRNLIVSRSPSWLMHQHRAEKRWVLAEAQRRGIDVEEVLGYDVESIR